MLKEWSMRKKNYRRPLNNKKGKEIILTSRSGKKRCNLQKNMKRLASNRAFNLESVADCNTVLPWGVCFVTSVKDKTESLNLFSPTFGIHFRLRSMCENIMKWQGTWNWFHPQQKMQMVLTLRCTSIHTHKDLIRELTWTLREP